MKRIGVIINPIAGMGGPVGLKGSDGEAILRKAMELGAKPESPNRAIETLKIISTMKDQIEVLAFPKEMGESELIEAGFKPKVIGKIKSGSTTSEDTLNAAKSMLDQGVDLLIFAGGDGTARNIYSVVKDSIPCLGIPAGVKIHSGVYAINPVSAGTAAVKFLQCNMKKTTDAEVMDLDEEEYRKGNVSAKLYGYMKVPDNTKCVQKVKVRSSSTAVSNYDIAHKIVDDMEKDVFYIIGPGTTTRSIIEVLQEKNTLIGVDVVKNKKVIINDVTEEILYNMIKGEKVKIIITAIGGQGHILGRGNQQISPRIIKEVGKENIVVVATKEKLIKLGNNPLLVDTGDSHLNEEISGFTRVIISYGEITIRKIAAYI